MTIETWVWIGVLVITNAGNWVNSYVNGKIELGRHALRLDEIEKDNDEKFAMIRNLRIEMSAIKGKP